MAFDKTQPKNTTKIRLLGEVIRPNWEAIESGDNTFMPKAINLENRVSSDPTAIANSVIIYAKEDTTGKPQLFSIDPDSVVTQLSGGGGSTVADLPGKYVTPSGLTFIWGMSTATTSFSARNFDLGGFKTRCLHLSGNASEHTQAIGFAFSSKTQYLVKCDTGSTPYFYLAIGI
jgi:hypothetical protein